MTRAALILLCLSLMLAVPAQAQAGESQAVPEYAMKAVYLYNFAQLTEWPTQPGVSDEAFNICIAGQDELYGALESLRGRMVNGRQLRPVRLAEGADARQCHLVYVGDGEGARGVRLLEGVRGHPVLTVTDDAKAARAGAMLVIGQEQRRLSFDVDLDAARRSQLKFSSKLLRLARKITGG